VENVDIFLRNDKTILDVVVVVVAVVVAILFRTMNSNKEINV